MCITEKEKTIIAQADQSCSYIFEEANIVYSSTLSLEKSLV